MIASESLKKAVIKHLQEETSFSKEAMDRFLNSTYFIKWLGNGKYLMNDALKDFRANNKYLDNNLVDYF